MVCAEIAMQSLYLIGLYGCDCMQLQPMVIQNLNQIVQRNCIAYTACIVMLHSCGKLVNDRSEEHTSELQSL